MSGGAGYVLSFEALRPVRQRGTTQWKRAVSRATVLPKMWKWQS